MHKRIDAVDSETSAGRSRKCCDCKTVKLHLEFHANRRDHMGIQRACKVCSSVREKTRGKRRPPSPEQYKKRYAKEREQVTAYSRAHYRTPRGRLLTLISAARVRARKRGLEHNIDIGWALERWNEQGGCCLITGIKLEIDIPVRTASRYQNPFAPSLDRENSEGGYTKNNTRIICVAANLALNRFGIEVFQKMLEGYAEKRRG